MQEFNDIVDQLNSYEKSLKGKLAVLVSEPLAAAIGAMLSAKLENIEGLKYSPIIQSWKTI